MAHHGNTKATEALIKRLLATHLDEIEHVAADTSQTSRMLMNAMLGMTVDLYRREDMSDEEMRRNLLRLLEEVIAETCTGSRMH